MPGSRRGRLLAALAVAGAVLAGCSGGEEPRGTVNVAMYDNFFARDVTRVPAGTRVRFPNRGRTAHNAVATDGSWRTPERVPADEVAAVVLDRPGVYRFYCTFHATPDGRQGMAATLVVGDVPYYPGQETAGPALRPVKRASGTVRRVPEDHDTIQAAVSAARPGDLILVGPFANQTLRQLNADLLVLGVHSIDARVGLTTPNVAEAETNRIMVAGAGKVVVVADSSKLGHVSLATFAGCDEVDELITDTAADKATLDALADTGLHLRLVDPRPLGRRAMVAAS